MNTKRLYGIIHQVELFIDNLNTDLQVVHDAPMKDKLNMLGQLISLMISIQLLLQDWQSMQDQIHFSTSVIIQVVSIEVPPQDNPT